MTRQKYNKIPTRIRVSGDVAVGKRLIGYSKKQLSKLDTDLSFRNLPTGRVRKILTDGTLIICTRTHNLSTIDIIVGGEVSVSKEQKECFCNCDFARGYILKASEGTPDYPSENRRYDVVVCNRKSEYILYKYILPSDHLDYESVAISNGFSSVEGFPVILFLDNNRPVSGEGSCCMGNSPQTACSPVASEIPSPTAVPVYRIVPIFLTNTDRWRDVRL